MTEQTVIGPQPGPQTDFLSSTADIAIYGGAAGGGKTYGLLLDPLRHIDKPGFGGVIFRRTTVQVRNEGALWDESMQLYPLVGGKPRELTLSWKWGTGANARKITFAHLEHEKSKHEYQGAQIPFIGFDELTHFTEGQFWYMVSRNRSGRCAVRPYIRATCNPDADSWVADLIAWWIDQDTGYPIPERAGKLRWFVRVGDVIIWADTPEELAWFTDDKDEPVPPKSLTFIPAKLSDNKAMNAKDPNYRANLMALPTVERERLLYGNWKIRPSAGLYFQRTWCREIEPWEVPSDLELVRGWDLAATPKTETNDPDWTCGTKIGRSRTTGLFYVIDHRRTREAPAGVKAFIKQAAIDDGRTCEVSIPQDPGSAGKSWAQDIVSFLLGWTVRYSPETGDKTTRFGAFSSQAQAGNVMVVKGMWNKGWYEALEAFPEAKHDDDADATSRALNHFVEPMKGAGMFELTRQEAEALGLIKSAEEQVEEQRKVPQYQPGSVEWELAQQTRH